MLIVTALGGNALLRRGEAMTAENQRRNVRIAAKSLAPVAERRTTSWSATATGRRSACWRCRARPTPRSRPIRSTCSGAQTEGMIGYMIEQELGNLLPFERPFATLLTMIEVDAKRPGLRQPDQVHRPGVRQGRGRPPGHREELGVQAKTATSGAASSRRPSPSASSSCGRSSGCSSSNTIVIAAGGGGIPAVYEAGADRKLAGIECVIDKDLATELLARELGADLLRDADRRRRGLRRLGQADAEGDPSRHARGAVEHVVRRRVDGSEGRRGLPLRARHRQARCHRRPGRPVAHHRRRRRHHDHAGGIRHRVRARAEGCATSRVVARPCRMTPRSGAAAPSATRR